MKGLTIQQPQQHAVEDNISNLTSASGEAASVSSSGNRNDINGEGMYPQHYFGPTSQTQSQPPKKKRNLPGNPDPDAEVIAMSPKSLLATNRFVCDICNKGFQRDQNLQLHRRGHNLPWKLKQRTSKEIKKKVYVCPETSCVHHDPSRALGDLTGIKKHFCRKHGEKKWKCDKCSKRYAVRSDLKAHSKTCGTKEYRCDCGTLFSRRDSFVSHKSLCDVLAEEGARAITGINANQLFSSQAGSSSTSHMNLQVQIPQFDSHEMHPFSLKKEPHNFDLRPEVPPWLQGGAGPGPGPGPSPPFDILSSSIFPTRLNRDISAGHETFQPESMCPLRSVIPKNTRNPNPSLGPSLLPAYHPTPTPQISATALLQKAAMVGATMNSNKTSSSAAAGAMLQQQGPHQAHHVSADSCNNKTTSFGLNLSSREDLATDQFVNNLASYGNKAAGDDGPPRTLFQEMMTSLTPSGFHGSTFNLHETLSRTTTSHDQFIKVDEAAANGGNGGNDGLTRDFLGLRPLSHSDIFNIAGLNSYMNSSSSDQQHHNRNQKPWQV